ncbi:MAG: tRNA uridine-5-carboxymethylaminomethyl(34) synthesis enzyme MnmG [Candidatus Stahlbacteria bacterium]|nr:tRNA uridine-5-carboxymethylaminomethyl(34) synthesis enzyme MnmG [Candidatus Stahlbacteria bacterium]
MSTSLPFDVQVAMLHTISGLEEVSILKPGYGIEYDFIYPYQVYPTLESKLVKNLWFAGQLLGTSGYEEAAAQGIIAGINAGLRVQNSKFKGSRVQFVLGRQEGYIGVLIDDLVTREISEPYRMFTSRVEHRLILRQDNAGERLMKYGVELGLVDYSYYAGVEKLKSEVQDRLKELKSHKVYSEDINSILESHNSSLISQPTTIFHLLKRPELDLQAFESIVGRFDSAVRTQIEIQAKYDGYIEREEALVKRVKELEDYKIPIGFDYSGVKGLSRESLEKLYRFRPLSVGQASRIAGVRFSDITCLLIALKK